MTFITKCLRTAWRYTYRGASGRVKRIIFWGSFLGHFNKVQSNPELLNKANTIMLLTRDSAALALPARLNQLLWGDNAAIPNVEAFLKGISPGAKEAFVKSVPLWLRYAEYDKMSRDMDKFVKFSAHLA